MLVVWPHEFFSALYTFHRDYFMKYVVPGVDEVKKFWTQIRGHAPTG